MSTASPNITWHHGLVSREERVARMKQKGATVWLTGLSGSGKSTVAHQVEKLLMDRGAIAYVLDGDNIRHGLNRDLGFSPGDREENIRRIGEVARLFVDANLIVLTAFISPYRADRDRVRALHAPGDFIEVHVDCPIEICETRDPKGLYAKARSGEVSEFTGVSAPYEAPKNPELVVNTAEGDAATSAMKIIRYLEDHGHVFL
jgi:adenylylsulfate kinase